MRILTIILLSLLSFTASATDFVVGSGSGSVSVTSMTGKNPGDRILIAPGAYTSFTFTNLVGITITSQSTRVSFSATCTLDNVRGVELYNIDVKNVTGVGISMSSGQHANVYLHNIFFQNITSSVISAHNNIQYDYSDTATLIFYKVTMDSIKIDSCGQFLQGSFGDPNSGGTTAPDVFKQLTLTRIEDLATRMSSEQGTGVRGICYHCSASDVYITDRSGRGPSGDVGWFYGSGAWHLTRIYKNGGPGYIVRMNGPMSEQNDPWDNWLTQSGKFEGTQYGFANYQFNGGDTITGKTYGPNTYAFNNTFGNQTNDTLGYWSTMLNFGQIPPNGHYYGKNNLAFNVGNNPQRAAAGGQPNNAKNQIAVNLGGWTTIATDTSNNKYGYSATVFKLDTSTIFYTNRIGSFRYYRPSTNSTLILSQGTTNPVTSTDYIGFPLRNPPDLGYIQAPPGKFNINTGSDQILPSGTTSTSISGVVPTDTINLIVIQGESNAAGFASNSPATSAERLSRSSVKIFDHNTSNYVNIKVGGASQNVQQDSYIPTDTAYHGVELQITNLSDSGGFQNPTYMVKIGVSGSYICQWLPGSTCRGVGQGLWENWVLSFVDPAIPKMNTIAAAAGKPYRIIVFQSLGLNDMPGHQNTDSTVFKTGMATFRAAFRARYGANIQFYSTNFYNPPGTPGLPVGDGFTSPWNTVWRSMAQSDPNFINLSVLGAPYEDQFSHWNYQGFKVIGRNFRDSLQGRGFGNGGTYTQIWSQISGPNTATIVSPTSKNTTITGTVNGTYVFRFTVTENTGAVKTKDMTVTVGGGELTFTPLVTDILSHNRGPQHWGTTNWDDTYAPTYLPGNTVAKNNYIRLNWVDIEPSTQGVYSWTILDGQINAAIDAGAMFTVSLMPMCTACGLNQYVGVPLYVHNLQQADGGNNVDWLYSGFWVPNWNNTNFITRYNAALRAMATHIAATSRSGKTYTSAFLAYDIRHYGDFGEGHNYPWNSSVPTGRQITDATLNRNIDSVLAIFPNVQLTIPMNYVAPNNDYSNASGNPGTSAAYKVLTSSNSYGRIGWRRDNLGDDGYNAYLTSTSASYLGTPLKPLIMDMYKFAPIGGEPARDDAGVSRCGSPYCDLHNENTLFGISYMGNGNYQTNTSGNATEVSNLRNAWAEQGYKILLTGGFVPSSTTVNGPYNISLFWRNTGIAPVYERWNIIYELRNSSSVVVWRDTSDFSLRLFLPRTTDSSYTDNYTLTGVSAGTYNLYVIIKDPAGYKTPFYLAINGRQSDGSYLIKSNVVVGTSSAPTANAGVDQTITLPTTTVTLDGSGSFGTISSYAWTLVSGPNTPTIVSPSNISTVVNGFVAGTYVFRLSVNGGTSTDDITVQVNTTPPPAGHIFTSQTPASGTQNDGQALEVGVKFRSTAPGVITGVRFYKTSGNTGTHIGELYSSTGTRLAQATFSGETSTGWQSVTFGTPVAITAGTTYIAAYHSASGNYVADNFGLQNAITAAPLTALAQGTDGNNGVYIYTATPAFPTATYQSSNYWVDVNYTANLLPTAAITFTSGSASITLPTSSVTLSGTTSSDPDGTISTYLWTLVSGPNNAPLATPSASSSVITGMIAGTYIFRLTVTDNQGGQNSKDQTVIVVNSTPTSIILHGKGGKIYFR